MSLADFLDRDRITEKADNGRGLEFVREILDYPGKKGRKMIRLPSLLTMSLVLGVLVMPVQAQGKFTATLSFQKGVNGYEGACDDSMRLAKIKLVDDRKQTLSGWHEKQIRQGKLKRAVVLEGLSNYRHVLRWDALDKWIRGNDVKVLSAKVAIFYTDEFWSFYDYEIALYRSFDGTKDGTEKEAAAVAHIFGERRGRKAATPFRSWITFDIRPEVIQAWVCVNRNIGNSLYRLHR